jgi:hypothetical protein
VALVLRVLLVLVMLLVQWPAQSLELCCCHPRIAKMLLRLLPLPMLLLLLLHHPLCSPRLQPGSLLDPHLLFLQLLLRIRQGAGKFFFALLEYQLQLRSRTHPSAAGSRKFRVFASGTQYTPTLAIQTLGCKR